MAAVIGDALRQVFMPKRDYQSLREEERASWKLQRPILAFAVAVVCLDVFISTAFMVSVVFPSDPSRRPLCGIEEDSTPEIGAVISAVRGDSDHFSGAFSLTDQETVDYFWIVVFVPTVILFLLTSVYLIAGIVVAFTLPARHWCINVVENNFCGSRRGGVRCLSILNSVLGIIFGLVAIFLGASLLTITNSCSLPLFWCYESAACGLVVLYLGTGFYLRQRATTVVDDDGGDSGGGRSRSFEMVEARPVEISPEVERRVNEGFKALMDSSLFSSDDDDNDDEIQPLSRSAKIEK